MQVDYEFVEKINNMANILALNTIKAAYEEDIQLHCLLRRTMYNNFENIIQACNRQMDKIGNV